MRRTRAALVNLVASSLLSASAAAPASAVPITTFNFTAHFRWRVGPNSVGIPSGDQQFVGVLNVAPLAGTAVTATQGAVTRPLPVTTSATFPTMFRALAPFDPALTGSWTISAVNGANTAGPLFTPVIANPQLLPFVEDLAVGGSGTTPTLTWTLPNLTGVDAEQLRFRVYNDLDDDVIVNQVLPLATTSFAIPAGLLFPDIPYAFSVSLEDTEAGNSENVATAFTQSAYVIPEPPDALVDLLVASRANGRVLRYDDATGAPIGNFVLPSRNGLESPTQIVFGPDGDLYVANGIKPDGTPPVATAVLRYDGASGEFIDVFSAGFPGGVVQIAFGPDGDLYGTLGPANLVFRADGDTGTWSLFAGAGSPLNFASGLAFGPDGDLYVGDFNGNQVLRFDGASGAYLGVFATVPLAGTQGRVGGLAFGPDGDLYAALAFDGNDVWRFDGTTGASLGPFIGASDPHPLGPMFLLFGPGHVLYVSSRDSDEVLGYDVDTGAFTGVVAVGGGLDSPSGIALPEPVVSTQVGAGLLGLIALARRRYRARPGRSISLRR
jgi:sugar lactone lactonase YvrE